MFDTIIKDNKEIILYYIKDVRFMYLRKVLRVLCPNLTDASLVSIERCVG